MNPNSVFFKWDKVECEAKPIYGAVERCALVDTFDLGRLRQVASLAFSPGLQKSVISKAAKRLREWPKDANGNFV